MQYEELEKELQLEIEKAEEIAIGYLQERINYSPFIYFGDNNIKKFIADSLDEAIELATEEIEGMDEETVVLIYKETIELNDGDFDAIVSQIYNVNEDSAYSFGLLYKIESDTIKFLNKRVFLGDIRNCLIY